MVQGAPQIAGRFPRAAAHVQGAAAGDLLRAVLRDRPGARVRARLLDPDGRRRCRSAGPSTCSPTATGATALREYMRDYNHWTTLGALCELLPQPDNRVTLADETDAHGHAGRALRLHAVRQRPGEHRLRRSVLSDIWEAAGAQDVLTIDRYAHLVGGCRMGTSPEESVVDADHRVWGMPNLFVSDGSVMPDPGRRQPGADDHGARLAAGGAARGGRPRRRPERPRRPQRGRPEQRRPSSSRTGSSSPTSSTSSSCCCSPSGIEVLSAFPKLYWMTTALRAASGCDFRRRCTAPTRAGPGPRSTRRSHGRRSWRCRAEEPRPGRHWHFMTIQFWILTGAVYVAWFSRPATGAT